MRFIAGSCAVLRFVGVCLTRILFPLGNEGVILLNRVTVSRMVCGPLPVRESISFPDRCRMNGDDFTFIMLLGNIRGASVIGASVQIISDRILFSISSDFV